MQSTNNEKINIEIMENELASCDWELNPLAWELYWWISFFQAAFFKGENVPTPALTFERSRVNNLGSYRIRRNFMGFKENINLNSTYLNRPLWDILATLLHELCHSWQKICGKPSNSWFHNKEFKMKLLRMGILCNDKGCHITIGDPFVFLLKKHCVDVSLATTYEKNPDKSFKLPPAIKIPGKSKLKKWSCGCTNVRVAVAEFHAKCLKCDTVFELAT